MDRIFDGFLISDNKDLIRIDDVCRMLASTYWAGSRPRETIEKSIENSLCFGVYKDGVQVGFARCVTDYSVLFYLCDVVIDSEYRGRGLGQAIMSAVMEHEEMKPLVGFLGTRDAHGLYEKFGFARDVEGTFMRRHL